MNKTLTPPNIVYVTDEDPGYTRIWQGDRMVYLDEQGTEIADKKVIQRMEQLVIPPNWEDTWICKLENGHLQCTGRDEKGRKQYLYHPDWMEYRQRNKFEKLKEFGEALPEMRKKINDYLDQEGYPKSKILALAVKLLDLHFLRIGNDYYLSENETYGLTTLRRKHLEEGGDKLKLSYKAKSNKVRNISIKNKKLTKLLLEVNELPGYEVFRYEEDGERKRIDSGDVNDFIRKISDDQFSAKDFRTWGGTVSAVQVFEEAKAETEGNSRKKLEPAIVRRVAKILGNTISTAREYYIHPQVLNHLLEEDEINLPKEEDYFKKSEQLVLDILSG